MHDLDEICRLNDGQIARFRNVPLENFKGFPPVPSVPITSEQIVKERDAAVAIGRTWIGTPFHDGARIKGAGVDCGHLLLAIYEECGALPHIDPGKWPRDWFMHAVNGERYLGVLGELGIEVAVPPERMPEPGDAVIWRYGHAFSHGALVTAWPVVIHCFAGRSVLEEDITLTPAFTEVAESETLRREVAGKPRPMKVFVPRRWVAA